MEHEIHWPDVEVLMTLDEADRIMKARGFVWPIWQVSIQKYGDWPLAYCFKFVHGAVNGACVGLSTGYIWTTQ